MKCYIIAGESSGDLHGSNLIKGLKSTDPEIQIRFWGGQRMSEANKTQPVVPLEKLSFMGFTEVLLHLPQIFSNLRYCKRDILDWQPDLVVFIDFPGFNLRLAKWAQKNGFPTHYYIAPQAWAWKKGRVRKMQKAIDHLYVILPFETDFFTREGMSEVHYEGHPLVDIVPITKKLKRPKTGSQIALLPGSRLQEIQKILPIMCQLAQTRPHQKFMIAAVEHIPQEKYLDIIRPHKLSNLDIHHQGPSGLLPNCDAAIVTSGTATLETALHGIPQIVVYKSSRISYEIARRVIQVPYISLVNLILQREAVPELIQSDCTHQKIDTLLTKIESDHPYRDSFKANYSELRNMLGSPGVSRRIAEKMLSNA